MKRFNFVLGLVFAMCLAILGDLNTGNPMKGWIIGVIMVSIAVAIGIGVGLIKSRFVNEEGYTVSFTVGALYLAVVLSPALFLKNWLAVIISFLLVIIWKFIYDKYNKE